MPLDDSDPYWAARFRMTPDQMDAARRNAEAAVRDGYHATTWAMAEAGEAAHRFGDQAGAAVDKFKVGVQAEIERVLGRPTTPRAAAPTTAPVQAAPAIPKLPSKRDAARAFGAGILLDRIAAGEGTGGPDGYDTTFGYRKYDPPGGRKPLAEMTLDELEAYQQGMVSRGARSSAAGRYQIMPETARELRGRMGLSGEERFTPELQDRMARERLKMAGYDAYLRGEISAAQLQERLSGAWTSVARANGAARNRQDPVRTDSIAIQQAIAKAKAEVDGLSVRGVRPDPRKPAWR